MCHLGEFKVILLISFNISWDNRSQYIQILDVLPFVYFIECLQDKYRQKIDG